MSRTQYKLNLASSSSPSSSQKAVDKKSKISISPNRYDALSEDSASTTESYSPPPVKVPMTTQGEVVVNHSSLEEPSLPTLDKQDDKQPVPMFHVKNITNYSVFLND